MEKAHIDGKEELAQRQVDGDVDHRQERKRDQIRGRRVQPAVAREGKTSRQPEEDRCEDCDRVPVTRRAPDHAGPIGRLVARHARQAVVDGVERRPASRRQRWPARGRPASDSSFPRRSTYSSRQPCGDLQEPTGLEAGRAGLRTGRAGPCPTRRGSGGREPT